MTVDDDNLTAHAPTPAQRAMVIVLRGTDYASSVTDACKEVGISRQSYYEWFEKPSFVGWWDEQIEAHFARRLPAVLAATFKGATKDGTGGSHADRKLFLERFDRGYAPRSRQEVVGEVAHTIEAGQVIAQLTRLATGMVEAREAPALPADVAIDVECEPVKAPADLAGGL